MTTGRRKSSALDCRHCPRRKLSEWSTLEDADLDLMGEGLSHREYLPGEVIFDEGEACSGVYCIESGLVGVRKSDADGNSVLLYVSQPGDTMGYRALIAGEEYRASAEALEPSCVCHVRAATVRTLIGRNPALGLRYLERVAKQLGDAEERILHNITLSVRARFAHLLTVLLDRHEAERRGGERILDLPLSRHDLAEMIGTTPESMSRAIHKLEQDGVAHFSGRTVRIPELSALISEFEPEHFV
jgi:CRP/FNR family transcriptional regulator